MIGKLSYQVDKINEITEKNAKYLHIMELIRVLLIEVSISALEFIFEKGYSNNVFGKNYSNNESGIVDTARKLLTPTDGTLCSCIDVLIPLVHHLGWNGVCISWFEQTRYNNERPLREEVAKWVTFRNNRSGHGVVAQNVIDENLPWLVGLLNRLSKEMDDLLPFVDSSSFCLKLSSGEVFKLKTIKPIEDKHVMIRKVKRVGTEWRVEGQIVDYKNSPEIIFYIPSNSAIPFLSSESKSIYVKSKITAEDGDWHVESFVPQFNSHVFIGRENEYSELIKWFDDVADSRTCLVYGEGGVGKTTLVLKFINDILDGNTYVEWKPKIICFYSAKQTQWTSQGLERLSGVPPTLSEALRNLIRVWEDPISRDWYVSDVNKLLSKMIDLFSKLGYDKNSILLILDNTETIALRREDEYDMKNLISRISKRLCRVILTSRRYEHIEAHPISVSGLNERESINLLRKLGRNFEAKPLIQAGDASLRKIVRLLHGRPILLEVFAKYASYKNVSLDDAQHLVQEKTQNDLGNFLFQDAWERINLEDQIVFYLLVMLGSHADETLLGWICAKAEVTVTIWQSEVFSETKFGTFTEHGTYSNISIDPIAQEFISGKLNNYNELEKLERISKEIKNRYEKLMHIDSNIKSAFYSAEAKLAKISALRGEVTDAIIWYDEAIKVDGTNAELWHEYALFLINKNIDIEKAKFCVYQAISFESIRSDYHFTMGIISVKLGDISSSDKYLIKASDLGKELHVCLYQQALVRIYVFEKKIDSSIRLISEAMSLINRAESEVDENEILQSQFLNELKNLKDKISKIQRRSYQE